MFTGIIEEIGRITRIRQKGGQRRLTVSTVRVAQDLKIGDSVSVSGVCLTAVEIGPKFFCADLAQETWTRTSFSRLKEGALVNLELPMRPNGRFGGHIVQGHVDATGKLLKFKRLPRADDYWLTIEIPQALTKYVISKGSICIEGISLTVAAIEDNKVSLAIIPHTVKMTNLQSLKVGDPVNLEVDMVAKYIEKMMAGDRPTTISLKKLKREGF